MLLVVAILFAPGVSGAAPLDQYASSVIGYSSQWSAGSWAAAQALGAPNTFGYGDIGTAWAPGPVNGSLEYITLGFATPVYASGATIRETYGNGFVYQIDAVDTSSVLHTVWTGTDPSLPGNPVNFMVNWTTSYLVQGVKIYVDTNHNLSAWEEIDAVRLSGSTTAAVPLPPSLLLLAPGLVGLASVRRRFRK